MGKVRPGLQNVGWEMPPGYLLVFRFPRARRARPAFGRGFGTTWRGAGAA